MLEFSIYIPRRRATKDHKSSTITFAIGNMIGKDQYIPLVDIDRKLKDKAIQHIIRTGWNLFGRCGYIVTDTMKGHHVIWITVTDWKTLNTLWTKLKSYLDRKWILMQRKRGYAVIRVRGKYPVRDLRIREVYDIMKSFSGKQEEVRRVYRWVKLYLALVGYQ